MIGLDTNVLFRVLIDEGAIPAESRAQARAAHDLVSGSHETFFVNGVVLAEAAWVLERRMRQPKAVLIDVLQRLLAADNVRLANREALAAALAGFRDGGSGFADHLIGQINRHAGCVSTMTFDKGAGRSELFTRLETRQDD